MSTDSRLIDDTHPAHGSGTPEQRTVGMTEAGLGLSLITCLLVVLGYVIIQRLGDRGAPATRDVAPAASTVSPGIAPTAANNGITPIGPNGETPNTPAYQTSYPPQWLPPQVESQGTNDIRSAQRPDANHTR